MEEVEGAASVMLKFSWYLRVCKQVHVQTHAMLHVKYVPSEIDTADARWFALSPSAPPCTLVATRHVAKTGGASVRDWMLQLEKHGHGRFFGPVTWMRYRGRCDGNKKFLHCCHPRDPRPVNECEQVQTRLDDSTRLDSTRLDSTPLDLARHGLT